MRISRKYWIIFTITSVIAIIVWRYSTYPQFAFLDFSIDRVQASAIAADYLKIHYNIDPAEYRSATVFSGRQEADRYLQKALGFKEQLVFLKENSFELFFWKTRFFKENDVEQFFVTVSTSTGEVTGVSRHISDSAARPVQEREQAKQSAIDFLKRRFAFDLDNHDMTTDLATTFDNRVNYTFTWTRNDISIPWHQDTERTGNAMIRTEITISGNDVLYFNKYNLDIPEEFSRYIYRIQNVGRDLRVLFRITFFALLSAATFFVLFKKDSLLLHTLKMPCLIIMTFLFFIDLIFHLNELEYVIYNYPTTSSFISYFWRFFSNNFLNSFMITVVFLMPFLAGELLHYEVFPLKRHMTLFHHIRSTFFSRNTAALIVFGYLTAIIMLGMQSFIFFIGENSLGVWTEYRWMSASSASYLPFIPAFVIAISVSLTEETMFRLFGISFGKKILKNTGLAVLLSSILWGFGHSGYPVYPMWFRGLEVTCLGIFLSVIYLKFGFIPVLIAHYLFDAFWCSANFLIGKSTTNLFYSALLILIWPLIFAFIAFLRNKPENTKPLTWTLSAHQRHNLKILKHYLKDQTVPEGKNEQTWINDIVRHGWDIAVVETAFNELKLNK